MNHDITPEPAQALSYKPSAFYFRQDLREAPTRDAAVHVASILNNEYEMLRDWSIERGLLPKTDVGTARELLRAAIEQSTSASDVMFVGLFLCHELEELKALVRAAGLIPPKWYVAPSEAEAKGWELHEAAVNE